MCFYYMSGASCVSNDIGYMWQQMTMVKTKQSGQNASIDKLLVAIVDWQQSPLVSTYVNKLSMGTQITCYINGNDLKALQVHHCVKFYHQPTCVKQGLG